MTMIRRAFRAAVAKLGDRQVRATISTGQRARDGHVLVPQGAQLDNFKRNPVVLWQHDPEQPIGSASSIAVRSDSIAATIDFAPAGVSAKADEICGLVKSGIVSALSIGFDAIDGDPIDPRYPSRGMRITDWELFECSFCSVPVDTGATVSERAFRDRSDGDADFRRRQAAARARRHAPYQEEILHLAPDDYERRQLEAKIIRQRGIELSADRPRDPPGSPASQSYVLHQERRAIDALAHFDRVTAQMGPHLDWYARKRAIEELRRDG